MQEPIKISKGFPKKEIGESLDWISESVKTHKGVSWGRLFNHKTISCSQWRGLRGGLRKKSHAEPTVLCSEMEGFSKQQQRQQMPLARHGIVPASSTVMEKPCNRFIPEGINYKVHCPASCHKGPTDRAPDRGTPHRDTHMRPCQLHAGREQGRAVSRGWGSRQRASS